MFNTTSDKLGNRTCIEIKTKRNKKLTKNSSKKKMFPKTFKAQNSYKNLATS